LGCFQNKNKIKKLQSLRWRIKKLGWASLSEWVRTHGKFFRIFKFAPLFMPIRPVWEQAHKKYTLTTHIPLSFHLTWSWSHGLHCSHWRPFTLLRCISNRLRTTRSSIVKSHRSLPAAQREFVTMMIRSWKHALTIPWKCNVRLIGLRWEF
jgi:hypothetical protein